MFDEVRSRTQNELCAVDRCSVQVQYRAGAAATGAAASDEDSSGIERSLRLFGAVPPRPPRPRSPGIPG